MKSLISHQVQPLGPNPFQKTFPPLPSTPQNVHFPRHPNHKSPPRIQSSSPSQNHHHHTTTTTTDDDDSIPSNHVKTLVKFSSRYNHIRVLEVSRRADHPFAGSRLLLLDTPGNIHSISFLLQHLTTTYFDVFATFPPVLPRGPIGILGFGAGSAARLILHLYPGVEFHGWELDPSVVSVGRQYFGLAKLEKQNPDGLFVHVGDALRAEVEGGFSGLLVDLFSKGSVVPELQEAETWAALRRRLRRGGRVMVNCGGSCVEAEDPRRDGRLVMEETLRAMHQVFGKELLVLNLGHRKEDSCLAMTGGSPDREAWKEALLSEELKCYVDMWSPYSG